MKPNNPLQVFKAIPRYAAIPFLRNQNKGKARALYYGSKDRWGEVIEAYPEHRFTFRSKGITAFEFQTSLAPWALSDSRTIFISDGAPSRFIEKFVSKHSIELIVLEPLPNAEDEQANALEDRRKQSQVPSWFKSEAGNELRRALTSNKPVLLYFPNHEDDEATLCDQLQNDHYSLILFDIANALNSPEALRKVRGFARSQPDLYRRIVMRRLTALKGKVAGFIFKSDLTPEQRLIVESCKTLGIPSVLIADDPMDASNDYTDEISKASTPLCDIVLGWGGLQKALFIERGLPPERYITTGSIGRDTLTKLKPKLSDETFFTLYGLYHDRKTILFTFDATGNDTDLDHQSVIQVLMDVAQDSDAQVLVRMPPSTYELIDPKLTKDILRHGTGTIDYSECQLAALNECISHADLVVSMDTALLTKAAAAGRSVIYVGPHTQLPPHIIHIEALDELDAAVKNALSKTIATSAEAAWPVEKAGKAKANIIKALNDLFVTSTLKLPAILTPAQRALQQKTLGVISIPSSQYTLETTQKYLLPLTSAQAVVDGTDGMEILPQLSAVDVFLQWGIKDLSSKRHQRRAARAMGKPALVAEDGFIRSVDIGLSGTPGLSLILDDLTAYYDASKPSRMELMLQDGPDLTATQKKRARAAIDKVVAARVSKYNHAPDHPLTIGSPDRPKILLVDQRYGDQAILSGMASDESFDRMIVDALSNHPNHDIIVKQHPDAITGGKTCYFNNERLAQYEAMTDRLFPIAFDINPFVLFDMVEEVYVATSGMGFEALMAGKKVHCYGVPYYSGWGVTEDRISLERRTRRRSIEDIFHFAYIECSRYYDPDKGQKVEVEDLVEYIVKRRDA